MVEVHARVVAAGGRLEPDVDADECEIMRVEDVLLRKYPVSDGERLTHSRQAPQREDENCPVAR